MPKTKLINTTSPGKPSTPIYRTYDGLIQGVSQQPEHLRREGQGQEQINGWSSPVDGLSKRQPMRMSALLTDEVLEDFYLEMFSITDAERYSVLVFPRNGKTVLQFWNSGVQPTIQLHGTGMTAVTNARGVKEIECDSTSYLYNAAGGYAQDYVLINSGAVGLLLNREKATAMSSDLSPAQTGEGLIFVQGVGYDVKYTVDIDGTERATFTTPSAADDQNTISTTIVAESLASQINSVSGFSAVAEKYVVHVTKDNNTDFTMEVDDGRSNTLAKGFTDSVPNLSWLPTVAPNGYIVNVESDPSTTLDDRYLKFTTLDGGNFASGAWSETVKPGIKYKFDVNTMPVVLYREGLNQLHLGPADGATSGNYTFPEWASRTAGDEETVPEPEFIGEPLRDHLLFRGRYVVCGGRHIALSETDDIFNFWPDSAAAFTATDPFGLNTTSELYSPLQWMIAIQENIYVFSATAQFLIRPGGDAGVLTGNTAEALRMSNLEMNEHVRPKLAGAQILFCTDHYGYTHVREFNYSEAARTGRVIDLGASNDITINLPKYMKGLATHWDVGEAVDMAVLIDPEDQKRVYVYKYLWQGAGTQIQKTQLSWSTWKFGYEVQWVRFMDNVLNMVVTTSEGTFYCNIKPEESQGVEDGATPIVHLDRRLDRPFSAFAPTSGKVTASYDSATDKTTFTLPYTPADEVLAVVQYENDTYKGLLLGTTETKSLVCTEKGDWTSAKVSFGERYDFSYQFTKAFVPDVNQAKNRVIGQLHGRTQVLRWEVNHVATGEYWIRVKRKNRATDSVTHHRSRQLNVANNLLNTESSFLMTGKATVPICSRNTDCDVIVESNSWLPVVVTSAGWEGNFSDRSKEVG